MSLTLWEPLRRVRSMNDFDRVIDGLFAGQTEPGAVDRSWRPAADLVAQDDTYVFRFDLPGVPREAITIDVVDGVLTVHGKREERKDETSEEGRVFRRETVLGSFRRSFRLPENIDPAGITAEHADGVLEVRVPRVAEAKPRRIEIAGNA